MALDSSYRGKMPAAIWAWYPPPIGLLLSSLRLGPSQVNQGSVELWVATLLTEGRQVRLEGSSGPAPLDTVRTLLNLGNLSRLSCFHWVEFSSSSYP